LNNKNGELTETLFSQHADKVILLKNTQKCSHLTKMYHLLNFISCYIVMLLISLFRVCTCVRLS